MIPLPATEIAGLVRGRAVGPEATVGGVSADSRDLPPEALFVALRGERDGHDFVGAAFEAGARAVLVEREDVVPPGRTAVVVEDTWAALLELATAVRQRLAPRVIAVTGSVGKTTTKDLIAAACASSRPTMAAVGSHNNELGVPLTLLSLRPDTEVLVVEVGARGRGHIASLMPTVRPDVAVVTAVGGGAHLSEFGTLEAVADAKTELVRGLQPGGVAVLNADDRLVAAMAREAPGRVLTVSALGAPEADLRATHVRLDGHARASFVAQTPSGRADVRLGLAGAHQVGNALAALAAASVVDIPLDAAAAALATAQVSRWRSEVLDVGGVRVLSDAYNANPTSTIAALDTLAAMDVPGRRWAVLGVMAELGPDHDDGHRRVGRHAAEVADVIVVVGEGAEGIVEGAAAGGADVLVARDVPQAVAALAPMPGDAVLVKASRVAGLERIVDSLTTGGRP